MIVYYDNFALRFVIAVSGRLILKFTINGLSDSLVFGRVSTETPSAPLSPPDYYKNLGSPTVYGLSPPPIV